MMIIKFSCGTTEYKADLDAGTSIAIATDFEGQQPNHFGAPKASRAPFQAGGFVGKTELGGSCNVDVISLVTHCNGTHTESVSHIVDDDVAIGSVAPKGLMLALVVSLMPVPADETNEPYRPQLESHDRVVTAAALKEAVDRIGMTAGADRENIIEGFPQENLVVEGSLRDSVDALIIRTLPNDGQKKSAVYAEDNQPPFLTCEAMSVVADLRVDHLLIDVPSIDRMYDDGLLTNHHLFWNVPEGTSSLSPESKTGKTISEMVFVPTGKTDGLYLLDLECPDWKTDAAPSRPVLFDIRK